MKNFRLHRNSAFRHIQNWFSLRGIWNVSIQFFDDLQKELNYSLESDDQHS